MRAQMPDGFGEFGVVFVVVGQRRPFDGDENRRTYFDRLRVFRCPMALRSFLDATFAVVEVTSSWNMGLESHP